MADTTSAEKKKVVTVTNPSVDAAVREKLITSRIALLLKAPFFGNLATRLELINADEWLSTAATDGRKFYYNSEFVNKLPQKQVEFLMGHEVLHVVYDHMGRRGGRIPQLYNIAADYCVNADLIEQRIGEKITVVPVLYDKKYQGMSSEEVYDLLFEQADKIDMKQLMDSLLDEHLDDEEDGQEGDSDGDGDGDKEGNGKGRPKLSKEERRQIRDEVREAVLQAAETTAAGNLPSGVRRMINQLTNPQLNWRELILQQVQSLLRSDFTWAKVNRKSQHLDAILPGSNFAKTIDVSISIDASGSMSEKMLRDILSEVKGIMESFDDFKLDVWSFDGDVYRKGYARFTPDNIHDIDTWECHGGGGTNFESNWEFMKDEQIEPKLLIMFTDMYPGGGWGDPDYCDTIFVNHCASNKIEAPFGTTVMYDFPTTK